MIREHIYDAPENLHFGLAFAITRKGHGELWPGDAAAEMIRQAVGQVEPIPVQIVINKGFFDLSAEGSKFI